MHFAKRKSVDGKVYVAIVGDNNEDVFVSETYESEAAADNAIMMVTLGAKDANVVDTR